MNHVFHSLYRKLTLCFKVSRIRGCVESLTKSTLASCTTSVAKSAADFTFDVFVIQSTMVCFLISRYM